MEAAVQALNMGKSVEVDKISPESVQAGGEAMIDIMQQVLEDKEKDKHMDSIPRYDTLKKGFLQLC